MVVVLGIFAAPVVFLVIYGIFSGVKHLIMHFVYKFDLFGAREKWLNDHPNWDKPYSGSSILAEFLYYFFKPKRPW